MNKSIPFSAHRASTTEPDYVDLLHYVELQARKMAWRFCARIPLEEFREAGYNGLVTALERNTNPRTFHLYAKRTIWGAIHHLPQARRISRRRGREFWQETHRREPLCSSYTAQRLAWLDRVIAQHHACIPPPLHEVYRAIRAGQPIGVDLARASGVSVSAISMIEAGIRRGEGLSVETAKKVAKALGVSLDYLSGMYDETETLAAAVA